MADRSVSVPVTLKGVRVRNFWQISIITLERFDQIEFGMITQVGTKSIFLGVSHIPILRGRAPSSPKFLRLPIYAQTV